MKFFEKLLITLFEGGNVQIDYPFKILNKENKKFEKFQRANYISTGNVNKESTTQISFQTSNILNLIKQINTSYKKFASENLWENIPEKPNGQAWENFKHYFSGSTYHFMGLIDKPINIKTFWKVKKKVGDVDIKVNNAKEEKIKSWLKRQAKKDFPITGIKFWISQKNWNVENINFSKIKNDIIKIALISESYKGGFFIPNNNNSGWNSVREEIKRLQQAGIIRRFLEILPKKIDKKNLFPSFWFLGFNPSGEQDITLWSFPKNPKSSKVTNERINVQMDFEYMNMGDPKTENPASLIDNVAYLGKIVGTKDFYPNERGKFTFNKQEVEVNFPGVHKAKALEAFTTGKILKGPFIYLKSSAIKALQDGKNINIEDKKYFEKHDEIREYVLGADDGLRRELVRFNKRNARILNIPVDSFNKLNQKVLWLDFKEIKDKVLRDQIFIRRSYVPKIEKSLRFKKGTLKDFIYTVDEMKKRLETGSPEIVEQTKKQILKYIEKMLDRSLQWANKELSVEKKLPGFLLLHQILPKSKYNENKWLSELALFLLQTESKDLYKALNKNENLEAEINQSLLDVENVTLKLIEVYKFSKDFKLSWKNLQNLKNNINNENLRELVKKDIKQDNSKIFELFPGLK
jgi:hypothetical protein